MDKLAAMRTFLEVAQQASFAGAARALKISPASVTRTIAALEDSLGADLFLRTTRTVRLSEAGERYAPECERILAEVAAADALAAGFQAEPSGRLTVTAPVMFGRLHLAPIAADFCDRYPQTEVELVLLDRVTNLLEEGFDVALRIGHLPDSGLRATRVGEVRRVIAGAPSYLHTHGVPQVPEDLKAHRIVAATSASGTAEWRFGSSGQRAVRVNPRLRTNNNAAAIAIATSGWGLTRVLSYQVGREITDGRLRLVLEDHEEEPLPVHLVHGAARLVTAKVRAFVDFAAARLRADPIFAAS